MSITCKSSPSEPQEDPHPAHDRCTKSMARSMGISGHPESWPLAKCNRVLRPLASKVRAFHDFVKLYPLELEVPGAYTLNEPRRNPAGSQPGLRQAQPRREGRTKRYEDDSDYLGTNHTLMAISSDEEAEGGASMPLDSDHRWRAMRSAVPEQGYKALSDIFEAFKRFLAQTFTHDPYRLDERAAVAVGRCMERSLKQSMFEDEPGEMVVREEEWYEASPATARCSKWVVLGQALEVMHAYGYALHPLLPSLVHHCIENGALFVARFVLGTYVHVVPTPLFWWNIQRDAFGPLFALTASPPEPVLAASLWTHIDFALIDRHPFVWGEVCRLAVHQRSCQSTQLLLVVLAKRFFRHQRRLPPSAASAPQEALVEALLSLWIQLYDSRQGTINDQLFRIFAKGLARFPAQGFVVSVFDRALRRNPRVPFKAMRAPSQVPLNRIANAFVLCLATVDLLERVVRLLEPAVALCVAETFQNESSHGSHPRVTTLVSTLQETVWEESEWLFAKDHRRKTPSNPPCPSRVLETLLVPAKRHRQDQLQSPPPSARARLWVVRPASGGLI